MSASSVSKTQEIGREYDTKQRNSNIIFVKCCDRQHRQTANDTFVEFQTLLSEQQGADDLTRTLIVVIVIDVVCAPHCIDEKAKCKSLKVSTLSSPMRSAKEHSNSPCKAELCLSRPAVSPSQSVWPSFCRSCAIPSQRIT